MNKILQLLAQNRGRGTFRADATGDEATIYLYDAIVSDDYFGGVSASAFGKALAGMNAATIHVRINCPGGDVFAGRAIEQAIREHPSNIVAHIDGYAASAASYVAIAADEVVIAPGGMLMIHNAWTLAMGNADDLRATADLLTKVDEGLVATYAARTGADPQTIRDWMAAETWFTADEAVAAGFADSVAAAPDKKKQCEASWNLSAYRNAPTAQLNAAATPESDFLTAVLECCGEMETLATDFVAANPDSALREFAEDMVEDCAGDCARMGLWLTAGIPADGAEVEDASRASITDHLKRQLALVANH